MKRAVGQDDVGFSSNALRPLWREFGVEQAWLFGGRARGKAGADSDWDFLVEFSGRPGFSNFMGLKCALEDALVSKVESPRVGSSKPRVRGFLRCCCNRSSAWKASSALRRAFSSSSFPSGSSSHTPCDACR